MRGKVNNLSLNLHSSFSEPYCWYHEEHLIWGAAQAQQNRRCSNTAWHSSSPSSPSWPSIIRWYGISSQVVCLDGSLYWFVLFLVNSYVWSVRRHNTECKWFLYCLFLLWFHSSASTRGPAIKDAVVALILVWLCIFCLHACDLILIYFLFYMIGSHQKLQVCSCEVHSSRLWCYHPEERSEGPHCNLFLQTNCLYMVQEHNTCRFKKCKLW